MLAYALVEIDVVFIVNIVLLSKPNRLVCIYLFPFPNCSLDLLCFLFGFLFHFKVFLVSLSALNRHFLLDFLLVVDVDWEVDELGVSLHNFRDLFMTDEFKCILFEIDSNNGSAS